jgi:hypothetical protein
MVRWLDIFGRYRLDSLHSRIDGEFIWNRLGPLLEEARRDQDGFLADLGALVADDRGGFPTLGAAGVVWEVYGADAFDIPAALPLIDAGIAFKQARGLPGGAFTGYEMQRVHQLRDRP